MKLPKQTCPKTQKKDCILCGKFMGWVDLMYPGRQPTKIEWNKYCSEQQSIHDKLRQQEFDNLRLI